MLEVYALLGSQAPGPSRADDAVIEKAVQESSEDTWRFLHLLAASPGEWLSIEEVRQKLDLGVHNLAGVLSTLPRRWRATASRPRCRSRSRGKEAGSGIGWTLK